MCALTLQDLFVVAGPLQNSTARPDPYLWRNEVHPAWNCRVGLEEVIAASLTGGVCYAEVV